MKTVRDNPRYLVTRDGRVINKKRGTELKPQPNSKGYLRVFLWYGDTDRPKAIHRLVADAFIRNPLKKPEVNHINADRTDNRVENLSWCTKIENEAHKKRTTCE